MRCSLRTVSATGANSSIRAVSADFSRLTHSAPSHYSEPTVVLQLYWSCFDYLYCSFDGEIVTTAAEVG